MAKEIVGLKIGASGLSAARVSVNGSSEVLQIAREGLPRGVVSGGEVREPEALAAALKDFFAKHKLPTRAVRIGIATNRIGVRTIEITGIDDPKLLANAVRFRAQEALPIPIDQAVLDFQVLGTGVTSEGLPMHRVLLVVAYRDLVDAYARACRAAGLRLAGVDLEAFALLRALASPPPAAEAAADRSVMVAVAIGSERSTLAVSDGLTCEFTRVLDWGGAALTAGIAKALSIEPAEAEELKTKLTPRRPARRRSRASPTSGSRRRARRSRRACTGSRATSSPRSSSTRASRTPSGSARSSSRAAPRSSKGSRPRSRA